MSMYYRFCSVAGRLVRATPSAYYPQGFSPFASQASQTKLIYEYQSTAPLGVASHLQKSIESGNYPSFKAAAFSSEVQDPNQAYADYLKAKANEHQFTEKVWKCIPYMLLPCFVAVNCFYQLFQHGFGKGVDRFRLKDCFNKDNKFDYIWREKPGSV